MNANLTFVQFMYNRLQGEMTRYLENYNGVVLRLPYEVSVEEYYLEAEDKSILSPSAIVEAIFNRANSLDSLKGYVQILAHLQHFDPQLRSVTDALRRYVYEASPERPMGDLDDGDYTDHEEDISSEEVDEYLQMGEQ